MDITHVLLIIILVLTAIIAVGVVVALALAISTLLEIFALLKTVRMEISTVSSALRAIGEGIAERVGGAFGLLDFFKKKPTAKKKTTKKK